MPSFPQKTPLLKQGGAESGALFGDDERLRVLLEAWAELPESVKGYYDTRPDYPVERIMKFGELPAPLFMVYRMT